jgi:hypothetical protein
MGLCCSAPQIVLNGLGDDARELTRRERKLLWGWRLAIYEKQKNGEKIDISSILGL